MIYCLVPEELADELLVPLRSHYRSHADVEVIVDRRKGERPPEQEDRRRPAVPRRLVSELPPELAAHARKVRWEQRIRPVRRRLQDATLDTLLGLIAGGDDDAHSELCWRHAGPVRARLAKLLDEPSDLDAAVRQTFGRLFDEIGRTAAGSRSFDVVLTQLADGVARDRNALSATRRRGASEPPRATGASSATGSRSGGSARASR